MTDLNSMSRKPSGISESVYRDIQIEAMRSACLSSRMTPKVTTEHLVASAMANERAALRRLCVIND